MQNLKSRWMQISEDDREEVLANRFGWMLKNLLEYGNTLVPNQAVRKNDISLIESFERLRPKFSIVAVSIVELSPARRLM